jgi:two-component system nitrate/nitrite sensor histidine kinase NarX
MTLRQHWKSSILLRLATVLGAVSLLAIGVVLTAAYVTERAAGKGTAINIAGSLRMQSYLLATRVADVRGEPAARAEAIRGEVAAFERRFGDLRLVSAVSARGPLHEAYTLIDAHWRVLKPQALAAAAGDAAAQARFLDTVDPFVAGIDRFVHALDADLESRIHMLQVALANTLFVILVLIVTAFFALDVQVFQPIKELVRVTQAVRRGDFTPRAPSVGDDELGQLSRDFNHMVEELGRLYGSLEAQIATKTADLAEKNRSLSLLYETARELSGPSLDRGAAARVAARVREVLGVQAVAICARAAEGARGWPLAVDPPGDLRADSICAQIGCNACASPHGRASDDRDAGVGTRHVMSLPLMDGERQHGVMPLVLAEGRELAPWQFELAQTVARHIGAAMAAAEARDEHRRLALMEERSAIARELHDSLAQALSYTQIQLARLSRLLAAPAQDPTRAQARVVAQQLREGVSNAYRQLRELLTTFRLQLNGRGLGPALAEAAADFSARSGVPVQLDDELAGTELSANEQIHVLQIVREALANVEHHAQARRAWVALRQAADGGGTVALTVEDDGVGLQSSTAPRHHFGLSIMRDRAAALGGTLEIGPRDRVEGTGTCVRLSFGPHAAYGAPAPRAAPTQARAAGAPALEIG